MEEDGEEIIQEIVIAREVVVFVMIWMQWAMCSAPMMCALIIIGWLKIKWKIILPRSWYSFKKSRYCNTYQKRNKTELVKQRTLFLTFRPCCKGGKLDFIVGEWWVSIIEICLFLPSPREMRGAIAAHNSSCFVIAHVPQDTLVQHKSSSSAQIPAPVWPQTSQYFCFFPQFSSRSPAAVLMVVIISGPALNNFLCFFIRRSVVLSPTCSSSTMVVVSSFRMN